MKIKLLALAFIAAYAHAATYYVATNGSDSNPGTTGSPFLTIQHAANLVNPGDTVIVRAGVYSTPATGSGSILVAPTRSGTSGNYITFRSETKWGAILDGHETTAGVGTEEGFEISASWLRIQDFEIRNFNQQGVSTYRQKDNGGGNVDVVGNHVHDIGRFCTADSVGKNSFFDGGNNNIWEQNLVHDIGRLNQGVNGCTVNDTAHDHGVYIGGYSGVQTGPVVKNNIFYNVTSGWKVQFYGGACSNALVTNNTFGGPANPGQHGDIVLAETLNNITIENNISDNVNTALLKDFGGSWSNVLVSHNLLRNGVASDFTHTGLTLVGNFNNTNPQLTDPSTHNYYPLSGSPVIGTGVTVASVTNDYAGTPRPQGTGYDIGAYEFIFQTNATYYVSSATGSDSNSGTDTAHPWQTLAKVTAGPAGGYLPGDTVKFNRGETWTSATFNTHNAGTSASPITYTNYGSGALPILDGGGTSTLMNINHNFITVTGLQFQNAGTFINFAGMDGTTITGNTMVNATNHFIYAGSGIAGTTVVTGNTLTVQAGHAGGNNSIEIWGDSRQNKSYTVSDNDIERQLSNNPNANCIVLAGTSNVLIERNICRGGTQGPGVKPYQNPSAGGANCSTGDPGTNNIKIRSNYVNNITTANNGDGELIEGEGCPTASAGGDQTNLEVAYNVLVCASGGVGVGSSDAIGAFHNNGYDIHGNVILGACQSGWPANQSPTTTPGMIRINAASTNVHVHNNTIVGSMPPGDNRPHHGIGYFPGSAGVAENNILKNLDTGVLCNGCGTVSADHNLFDTDVTRNYSSGITDNGNNLNVSPKFVGSTITTAEDVKLQTGSPAINSGVALGTGFKFILDPNGTGPLLYSGTYDQSSGWMRGAFGFTGQSPPAITGFVANPTSISTGGSSQLTCTATNFTSLAITPGVGNVSSGVPVTVSPSATTQYDCKATNAASFVDAFATVTVGAAAPVINSFTANPTAIVSGQTSVLSWTTTGATTCSIDHAVGLVPCGTSQTTVSPTPNTVVFTLTATNSANVSVTRTTTVAVNVPTSIKGAVMQGAIIP